MKSEDLSFSEDNEEIEERSSSTSDGESKVKVEAVDGKMGRTINIDEQLTMEMHKTDVPSVISVTAVESALGDENLDTRHKPAVAAPEPDTIVKAPATIVKAPVKPRSRKPGPAPKKMPKISSKAHSDKSDEEDKSDNDTDTRPAAKTRGRKPAKQVAKKPPSDELKQAEAKTAVKSKPGPASKKARENLDAANETKEPGSKKDVQAQRSISTAKGSKAGPSSTKGESKETTGKTDSEEDVEPVKPVVILTRAQIKKGVKIPAAAEDSDKSGSEEDSDPIVKTEVVSKRGKPGKASKKLVRRVASVQVKEQSQSEEESEPPVQAKAAKKGAKPMLKKSSKEATKNAERRHTSGSEEDEPKAVPQSRAQKAAVKSKQMPLAEAASAEITEDISQTEVEPTTPSRATKGKLGRKPASSKITLAQKRRSSLKLINSMSATKVGKPSTRDMVLAALTALHSRTGTSLQAIKKFMSETYGLNVVKSAASIRTVVKQAVAEGEIFQTKGTGASGSFKLNPVKTTQKHPSKATRQEVENVSADDVKSETFHKKAASNGKPKQEEKTARNFAKSEKAVETKAAKRK